MPSLKARPIHSLVGLRFFAALIVVAFHFAKPESGLLQNFVQNGFVGVTLFFILSGFILSYTYIVSPGAIRGTRKEFWVARIARIYPMYLFSIVLFSPIILIWGHGAREQQLVSGLASILLIQTWFQDSMPLWNAWNPPGWSLSVEAIFYLIFPFVCAPLSKMKNGNLMLLGTLFWIASALPLFVELLTGSANFTFWYYNPVARLPEFLLGIASGIVWKNRKSQHLDVIAPYAAGLALLVLAALLCSPIRAEYLKFGLCAPLFVVLIFSLACERGLLVNVLSWHPIVRLGAASYSLYILHWPLWHETNYIFAKLGLKFPTPAVLFWTYVVLAVIASYVCFRYIEEPASRKIRRWLSGASMTGRRDPILATLPMPVPVPESVKERI